MQTLMMKYREDAKAAPTRKEFKDSIFQIEPIARATMEILSLDDAIDLIRAKKEFIESPIDDHTGDLRMVWKRLLDFHWKAFILNNSLALLKRHYGWSFDQVDAVYTYLWQLWKKFVETNDQYMFPLFYLPEKTPWNQEYVSSLYANLAYHYPYGELVMQNNHGEITSIRWLVDEKSERKYAVLSPNEMKGGSVNTKEDRLQFASILYQLVSEARYIGMLYPDIPSQYQSRNITNYSLALASLTYLLVHPIPGMSLFLGSIIAEWLGRGGPPDKMEMTQWMFPSNVIRDLNYNFRFTYKFQYLDKQKMGRRLVVIAK